MTPEEFTQKLERAAETMRPRLQEDVAKIGEFTKKVIQEIIIGHEHTQWPPLAASTIERKQSGGWGEEGPLLRTGALRDSIKVEVGPLETTVSTSDPAAAPAEFGTSREPPRPFMRLGAEEALTYAVKVLKITALEPFVVGYKGE
jgi:hypothetical protein